MAEEKLRPDDRAGRVPATGWRDSAGNTAPPMIPNMKALTQMNRTATTSSTSKLSTASTRSGAGMSARQAVSAGGANPHEALANLKGYARDLLNDLDQVNSIVSLMAEAVHADIKKAEEQPGLPQIDADGPESFVDGAVWLFETGLEAGRRNLRAALETAGAP